MKNLITIIIMVVVVGCGEIAEVAHKSLQPKKKTDQNSTKAEPVKESTPTTNTNKVNGPRVHPDGDVDLLVKELTPEEKIIGTYEHKGRVPGSPVKTIRFVFLDNGVFEQYNDGQKEPQSNKWSIVDNEVHVKYAGGSVSCFQINPDNSLSYIVYIIGGKRTDIPKQDQQTYKKLK